MKLLGLTDLHGNHSALDRILTAAGAVDLILLGGDLTNFGSAADAEAIVRHAGESGADVLAVAGNCDSADIDRRLAELGASLAGCGRSCEGLALQGLSAMPPWLPNMYQFSEEELAALLEAGYAELAGGAPHVVLSHCPPHGGKLDRTRFFQHVGSTALRAFVDEKRPALVVCGHVHEAHGIEELGPTTVVNCGAASRGRYAIAEVDTEVAVELHRA